MIPVMVFFNSVNKIKCTKKKKILWNKYTLYMKNAPIHSFLTNLKIKTDENSIFTQKIKFTLQFKVKFYKLIYILILYPIICHLHN